MQSMAAAAPPGKTADSEEVSTLPAGVMDGEQGAGSKDGTDAGRGHEDSSTSSGAAPGQQEAGMKQQDNTAHRSGDNAAEGRDGAGSQEEGPNTVEGDSRADKGHKAKVEIPTSAFGAAELGSSPAATPEGTAHDGKAAGKRLDVWLDGGKSGFGRVNGRRLSRLRSAYSSIGGRLRGNLSRCFTSAADHSLHDYKAS